MTRIPIHQTQPTFLGFVNRDSRHRRDGRLRRPRGRSQCKLFSVLAMQAFVSLYEAVGEIKLVRVLRHSVVRATPRRAARSVHPSIRARRGDICRRRRVRCAGRDAFSVTALTCGQATNRASIPPGGSRPFQGGAVYAATASRPTRAGSTCRPSHHIAHRIRASRRASATTAMRRSRRSPTRRAQACSVALPAGDRQRCPAL
jgi:hypothetical protein